MPTDDEKSELLARWNATLPRQQELGENLITRYSEPHRRYSKPPRFRCRSTGSALRTRCRRPAVGEHTAEIPGRNPGWRRRIAGSRQPGWSPQTKPPKKRLNA